MPEVRIRVRKTRRRTAAGMARSGITAETRKKRRTHPMMKMTQNELAVSRK